MTLATAPFPYFGGKTRIALEVWTALGQPKHYVEPFFGSGAALLLRPGYDPQTHVETVCDSDGYIANVWRSITFSPDETAEWCDWPVNHADLAARRKRLIENELRLLENLVSDDEWHDPKMAGYWIWAASCWIGNKLTTKGGSDLGGRPHLADGGKGVHKLSGRGGTREWFRRISNRLRHVRVVCGDWARVCSGDWQDCMGVVGIFFDPPYGVSDRDKNLYHADDLEVASKVRAWALERGARPIYRIVLAGYAEEHAELLDHGWTIHQWSARGGYANQGDSHGRENRHREVLFRSPHCSQPQGLLFGDDT